MKKKQIKGFWSYAKIDDSEEKVSALKTAFEKKLHQSYGRRIEVYQDTPGTKWGERWRNKIDSELNGSKFLIAILTPCYFNQKYCQYEFNKAIQLDIDILPIYYRKARIFEGETREDDSAEAIGMAEQAAEFQYHDFRELRNKDTNSEEIQSFLDKIAEELTDKF